MTKLKFVPYEGIFSDFLIVANDTPTIRASMTEIGAQVLERDGYTAYLWNTPVADKIFIGIGVIDNELILGPKKLKHVPLAYGAGSYVVLDFSEKCARVHPDLFGMHVIYQGCGIVTNRLHLAALVVGKLDSASAISNTYCNQMLCYSFTVQDTPVKGISMLLAGQVAEVKNQVTVRTLDGMNDYSQADPHEYHELIRKGAEEIISNVQAVLNSGYHIISDISGGKDSRIIFAAIAALGRIQDVGFNTHANNPALQRDLEIGTGLVNEFGGSYTRPIPIAGYATQTLDQALLKRRSQLFGTYHYIVSSEVNPVIPLQHGITIRMLGGCGELYRDYYQGYFTTIESNIVSNDRIVYQALKAHVGDTYSDKFFEVYIDHYQKTFSSLPGRTFGEKLDSHYLNFRNRYHFGVRQTFPSSAHVINPAASLSLLKAARSLPFHEKATGRVLFDVTKELHEKLAFYPHDKPSNFDYSKSDYHKKSKYDGIDVTLDPALFLIRNDDTYKNPCSPIRPVAQRVDFKNMLLDSINTSRRKLNDSGTIFSDLNQKGLDLDIEYSYLRRESRLSAWSSRLSAYCDYIDIMDK